MTASLSFRAAIVSLALLFAFLLAWHLATRSSGPVQAMDPAYAKLMGAAATEGKSPMPGPLEVGAALWEQLRRPFYDNGAKRQGHRHPAWLFARPGADRLFAGDRRGYSDRLPDRHVAVNEPGARSVHSGAQADLAARLDAACALHHQGFQPVGHLRHFHLFAVADAHQYGVRCRIGAARMAQRRKDARSRTFAAGVHHHSAGGRRRPF
jgi:hypothetical protein